MSTGKFFWGIKALLFPVFLFYAGYFLMSFLIIGILMSCGRSVDSEGTVGMAHLLCMCMAGVFLLVEAKKEKSVTIIRKKDRNLTEWLEMPVMAVGSVVIMNEALMKTGLMEYSKSYQRAAESLYSVQLWEGILLYALVVPFVEELLFRYLIFSRLLRIFSAFVPAAFLSALAFGIYHGNIPQAIYATVLGIELAFVYYYFGSFKAAVIFHGLGNLIIYLSSEMPKIYAVFFQPVMIGILTAITTVIIFCFIKKRKD